MSILIKDKLQNTAMSIEEYDRKRIEYFNNSGEGSCPLCKGKGFIAKMVDGYEYVSKCECQAKAINENRIRKSGLADIINKYTFESFKTDYDWQKRLKASALKFIENTSGWFYVGGQTGCGKTHICTAIVKALMDKGYESRYVIWPDEIIKLKANKNNDEQYQKLITPLQITRVLYIDDFFKLPGGAKASPSQSDIITAFEIINYRYINRENLITIISSEHSIDDLIYFDEALGSRIHELSTGSRNIIKYEAGRNYRLNK